MEITTRQVTEADYDFLITLRIEAMGGYAEKIYDWDENAQKEYFKKTFKPGKMIADKAGCGVSGGTVVPSSAHAHKGAHQNSCRSLPSLTRCDFDTPHTGSSWSNSSFLP